MFVAGSIGCQPRDCRRSLMICVGASKWIIPFTSGALWKYSCVILGQRSGAVRMRSESNLWTIPSSISLTDLGLQLEVQYRLDHVLTNKRSSLISPLLPISSDISWAN